MANNEWLQVRKIFADALSHSPEDRLQFVRAACGDDENLLEEVQSLLDSHDIAESFLETPALVAVAETALGAGNRLAKGTTLLHYEIRSLIGSGGMGEIYLARDTRLNRNVAIKLLHSTFLPDGDAKHRLFREARAAALLEHPNICQIYEIAETDEHSFIVMQYVVGTTLADTLATNPPRVADSLDIAIQIADGLAEAHAQGIIHRDIKPANIMVNEKGLVKILDFGLAKFIEAETNVETARRLNSSGALMGTVPFMSPEQLRGQAVDGRSDIFSFGAVLYEMIAGQPAYTKESKAETISSILNEEPELTLIPKELRSILQKCIAKDVDQRYKSAAALRDDIREVRELGRFENGTVAVTASLVSPVRTHDEPTAPTQGGPSVWPSGGESIQGGNEIVNGESDLENSGKALLSRIDQGSSSGSRTGKTFSAIRSNPSATFIALLGLGIIVSLIGFGVYSRLAGGATAVWPDSASSNPPSRLYWEMNEVEQLAFIRERSQHVQSLIGDEITEIDEEPLRAIKNEIDDYVKRRDSLSDRPFREPIKVIYPRAAESSGMIIDYYDGYKLPPALGLYQAMVESEYHQCLISPTGSVGLFQFTKKTAAKYELLPEYYCNNERQADSAAWYTSDIIAELGEGKSNSSLALLTFTAGSAAVREYLKELRDLRVWERSYWAIIRHKNRFKSPMLEDGKYYIPRFFAAAIIGETPRTFDLQTPPLTSLRFKGTNRQSGNDLP